MSKLKLVLGLMVCAVFACEKVETPPSTTTPPVFSIEGNLSGEALNIIAGEEDYYLFTSYETDALNVRSFVGTFAKIDCLEECQDTFRIKIRDNQELTQNGGNIEESIFIGSYDYKNNEESFTVEMNTIYSYTTTFNATSSIPSMGNIEYTWEIDSVEYSDFNPILSLDLDNQPNEIVDVSLTVKAGNGTLMSRQEAQLSFGTDDIERSCYTTFETSPVGQGMLFAQSSGTAPFSYLWSDGSTDSSIQVDTLFYSVTVTDAVGCVNVASVSTNPNFLGGIECMANFSISSQVSFTVENDTTFTTDSLQFSSVVIEYVNADGEFYSSELATQPTSAAFSILEIKDFDNNENGDKTKQLTIDFNCILGTETALPPLQLTSGKGTIAIAYPE